MRQIHGMPFGKDGSPAKTNVPMKISTQWIEHIYAYIVMRVAT